MKSIVVAKRGGGYYAYLTSNFDNRLIVSAYDPNSDCNGGDAELTAAIVLNPPLSRQER